jgi:phenol 2-monooxygenase (NADPH)
VRRDGATLDLAGRLRSRASFEDPEKEEKNPTLAKPARMEHFQVQNRAKKYTPKGAESDSVVDVRAVFQQHHRDLVLEAMPAFLLPRKGRYGLLDYEKMLCPDLKNGRDIFAMRGIDQERGCMVVVRPVQYVAHVLPLDGYAQLAAFFGGFMLQEG